MTGREAPVIVSPGNVILKKVRSLLRRKGRYEERAFLVEGFRAVFDVLMAGFPVEIVLLRTDAATPETLARIPAYVPVRLVERVPFDASTDVRHSQGIMAIVSMDALHPGWPEPRELGQFVLVVDGVRDPGNLGTLIRSAASGGASECLLTPRTVDPFNPKTVRAAMGAHFRIPVASYGNGELVHQIRSVSTIALADAAGAADYTDIDWTGGCAVIIGGEADGASIPVREMATITVRIPLAAGMESLNAGVAGSLLIFEAARQRRHAWSP